MSTAAERRTVRAPLSKLTEDDFPTRHVGPPGGRFPRTERHAALDFQKTWPCGEPVVMDDEQIEAAHAATSVGADDWQARSPRMPRRRRPLLTSAGRFWLTYLALLALCTALGLKWAGVL